MDAMEEHSLFLDAAKDARAFGLNKETGSIAQQFVLGVVQPRIVGSVTRGFSIVVPGLY
ncbi:MAG: hypothetical protein ABI389_05110 [Rhodanobacter sp.]